MALTEAVNVASSQFVPLPAPLALAVLPAQPFWTSATAGAPPVPLVSVV